MDSQASGPRNRRTSTLLCKAGECEVSRQDGREFDLVQGGGIGHIRAAGFRSSSGKYALLPMIWTPRERQERIPGQCDPSVSIGQEAVRPVLGGTRENADIQSDGIEVLELTQRGHSLPVRAGPQEGRTQTSDSDKVRKWVTIPWRSRWRSVHELDKGYPRRNDSGYRSLRIPVDDGTGCQAQHIIHPCGQPVLRGTGFLWRRSNVATPRLDRLASEGLRLTNVSMEGAVHAESIRAHNGILRHPVRHALRPVRRRRGRSDAMGSHNRRVSVRGRLCDGALRQMASGQRQRPVPKRPGL